MTRRFSYSKIGVLFLVLPLVLTFLPSMSVVADANYTEYTWVWKSLSQLGHLHKFTLESYAVAHNSTEGTVSDTEAWTVVGQDTNDIDWWSVDRGVFMFDTSTVPDDAEIVAGNFSFNVESIHYTNPLTLVLQHCDNNSIPHRPLENGDFAYTHYAGMGGNISSPFLDDEWYNFTLSAQGLTWINETGYTKFVMRSQDDVEYVEPHNAEYIHIRNRRSTYDRGPKLYVRFRVYDTEENPTPWYVPSDGGPVGPVIEEIEEYSSQLPKIGFYLILATMGVLAVGGIVRGATKKARSRKPRGRVARPRKPRGLSKGRARGPDGRFRRRT